MAVISKDLGAVTAYAAAVNRGYTGTKEEFETLMASYATVAQQAAESASNASQSATNASQSAQNAETAKGTAQQAATDAQTAQASAQGYAQSAQQSAQSASQSAQSAESAKNTAVNAVDGFAAGAQQALDSVNQAGVNWKSLAQAKALDSEAYALGTRDGEDVGSSDPAYHNNAKYYAEHGGASAQTASNAAQTATAKAQAAQASASAAAESARTLTIDKTLTQSGQAADAKKTGDEISDLKSGLSETTRNLIVEKKINKQIEADGKISTLSGNYAVVIAPVEQNKIYALKSGDISNNIQIFVYSFFESYPNTNVSAYGATRHVEQTGTVVSPINGYIALRSKNDFDEAQIEEGTTPTAYIPHITATDFIARENVANVAEDADKGITSVKSNFVNTKNLIDPTQLVAKYISNSSGSLTSSDTYYTTDFIPVTNGQKITISPSCRKYLAYDTNKGPITSSYDTNGSSSAKTYTAGADGYVRFSYVQTNQEQAEYGDTATEYVEYGKMLSEDFMLNARQKNQISELIDEAYLNVLFGKKIVFCGDSFTEGDFSGLQATNFQFQSGKYVGKKKVYPYFIGLRTGAEIVNEAISGSTMAYVDGNRNEFSTPNGRYTQIPADADYIILYFGINDSHQSVPIGAISDNTNTTFYGAWNIAMQYLLEHHPDAKIGIIISNGCDRIDYPNAEIAIAKKYGVSYLDFNSDYKVPILFRVNGKPETDASIIQANYEHYRVSSTNGHPNVVMHEYESTIIQHWLESI